MSTYTEVYLRKGNTFALLSSTGASSCRSEMLSNYAPWGKLRPLEASEVRTIISEYTKHLHDWEERAQLFEKRKSIIAEFNNTYEEKIEALDELDNDINEIKETMEQIKVELNFMELLDDILGYSEESGVYVYVGQEPPTNPTPADIEGGENLTPEQIAGQQDDDSNNNNNNDDDDDSED